jgi:hypothetical protein
MSKGEDRERGLPALQRSREQRRRALVLGKVRLRESAPQFWLWTAVFLLGFSVVYWHWSERELDRQKSAVMAKQRAVAVELEPRLLPLRDRVEAWVLDLAAAPGERFTSPELSLEDLSKSKGLYLRLLLQDAQSAEAIRKAAPRSLHDGFTSCLFERKERMDPSVGKRCFNPAQCADGELCNDWGICSPPTQPFNLRLMYGAMRLLSPTWTDELHATTTDYQVRVFERDLEKVVKTDVRIALELATTAKYFTLVLDEPPADAPTKGKAKPKSGSKSESKGSGAGGDAGAERAELRVQGRDHTVRVGVWDLASGRPLLRDRLLAGAEFVPMGRSKVASEKSLAAQQRQVNNCGIAADLRERVSAAQGGSAADVAAPAASSAAPPRGPIGTGVTPTAAPSAIPAGSLVTP